MSICQTCAPTPDEVNHPPGMIFVGYGHGWQTCPRCNGTCYEITTTVEEDTGHIALRACAKELLPKLKWRHHGIGALQAYVSEGGDIEHRVHIWSPRLVKPGMTDSGDIHDHRFDMVSHVLYGIVGHDVYDTTPDPQGDWTTMKLTHARAAADSDYHGPTQPTGERFKVHVEPHVIPAGSMYKFIAERFHRSVVQQELTVTWVEKHNQRDIQARLLHPIDKPPIMAFGHEMDEALVEELVALAASRL